MLGESPASTDWQSMVHIVSTGSALLQRATMAHCAIVSARIQGGYDHIIWLVERCLACRTASGSGKELVCTFDYKCVQSVFRGYQLSTWMSVPALQKMSEMGIISKCDGTLGTPMPHVNMW